MTMTTSWLEAYSSFDSIKHYEKKLKKHLLPNIQLVHAVTSLLNMDGFYVLTKIKFQVFFLLIFPLISIPLTKNNLWANLQPYQWPVFTMCNYSKQTTTKSPSKHHLGLWFGLRLKPASYFLRMWSECWRHKFATTTSQQFNSAQLTCKYRCERKVVTSNSRQIGIAFAFAGSMNRALAINSGAVYVLFGVSYIKQRPGPEMEP